MYLFVVSKYSRRQKLLEVKDNAVEILETAARELEEIQKKDISFGRGHPSGTVYVLPSRDVCKEKAIATIEDYYNEYDYFGYFKVLTNKGGEFYYTTSFCCDEVADSQLAITDGFDVFPFLKSRLPKTLEEFVELSKKLEEAVQEGKLQKVCETQI